MVYLLEIYVGKISFVDETSFVWFFNLLIKILQNGSPIK